MKSILRFWFTLPRNSNWYWRAYYRVCYLGPYQIIWWMMRRKNASSVCELFGYQPSDIFPVR